MPANTTAASPTFHRPTIALPEPLDGFTDAEVHAYIAETVELARATEGDPLARALADWLDTTRDYGWLLCRPSGCQPLGCCADCTALIPALATAHAWRTQADPAHATGAPGNESPRIACTLPRPVVGV